MQILAPYGRYDAPFAVKFGTEKHTTFLGAPVPTPFFTDEGQIWFGVLEQTQGLHLQAKFRLNVFIVSASGGQKPQFWAKFGQIYAVVRAQRTTLWTDQAEI